MNTIAEILGKMNTIIIIVSIIVMPILIFFIYMACKKIGNLEKVKVNLKDDNSKLSDALRKKGIEVDQLKKKIKRLEEGK